MTSLQTAGVRETVYELDYGSTRVRGYFRPTPTLLERRYLLWDWHCCLFALFASFSPVANNLGKFQDCPMPFWGTATVLLLFILQP